MSIVPCSKVIDVVKFSSFYITYYFVILLNFLSLFLVVKVLALLIQVLVYIFNHLIQNIDTKIT